jgi:hypothetical protein
MTTPDPNDVLDRYDRYMQDPDALGPTGQSVLIRDLGRALRCAIDTDPPTWFDQQEPCPRCGHFCVDHAACAPTRYSPIVDCGCTHPAHFEGDLTADVEPPGTGVSGIYPRLEVFERIRTDHPVRIRPTDWACSTCHFEVLVSLIAPDGRLPCGHDLGCPPQAFRVRVDQWTARYLMAKATVATLTAGRW